MDNNFILTKGKYAGKSIFEVEKINPSYLKWAKENAPNLLKEDKPKKIKPVVEKEEVIVPVALQPNLDFLNQKNDKFL